MERITLQSFLRLSLHRVRTVLTVALVLLFVLTQSVSAEDNITNPYARPGMLVNIGTHYMHIYCLGEGVPAVILDTGLGGSSLEWINIQKTLANHTRICIYDRSGYGWSYPGPGPRTSSLIADELFLLLNEAGVDGPYVLVGHSFGGYNMQIFASRYQYKTAGLVLVDSSHAEQIERFAAPPINVKLIPSVKGKFLIARYKHPKVHFELPDELKKVVIAMQGRISMQRTVSDELQHFHQSAVEVKSAGVLPNVPLIVLTRGQRVWPNDQQGDLMEQLWFQLQSELALRGSYYAHYVAKRSGHNIHLDQPHLVIDAIKEVMHAFSQRHSGYEKLPEEEYAEEGTHSLFENTQLCTASF